MDRNRIARDNRDRETSALTDAEGVRLNQKNSQRGALVQTREYAFETEGTSRSQVLGGSALGTSHGNLFLAIALVQSGLTDLAAIAEACHLPLDTVEEIAAAHKVNLLQTEQSNGCNSP